jgi:hypothetical protein
MALMQRLSRFFQGVGTAAAEAPMPKQLPKFHNWKPAVLGKGAFGTAVLPGPPNTDPTTGQSKSYRRRPVKMMKNEVSFKKSIQNAEKVRSFPHIKYNFVPYQSHIKVSNLPNNLRASYQGQPNNTQLYLAHMPHLGEAILKISNSPELLEKISLIPVTIYMREILKLFQTIKGFADAGYAHNDLHANNVLINPDTGEINIIDFDLLAEYPKEAPKQSEELNKFLTELSKTEIPTFEPVESIADRPKYYQDGSYLLGLNYLNDTSQHISFEKVKDIKVEIKDNGLENTHKKYLQQYLQNIDLKSGKLQGTLITLFTRVLIKPQYEEFRKFMLNEIIPRMDFLRVRGNADLLIQAFSIQDIIDPLQDYIDEKSPYSSYNINYSTSRSRKAGGRRTKRRLNKRKYTRRFKH